MSFDSIINRAEFFSDHYLDARLAADLEDLRKGWDAAEGRDRSTGRSALRSYTQAFFDARAAVTEASPNARVDAVRTLNDVVLRALGFEPERTEIEYARNTGTDNLAVTIAARVDTATGPLLVAIDAGAASEADELFDIDPREDGLPAGLLLSPMHRDGGKVAIRSVSDAPGELFSVDDPPRFVLVVGGSTVLLAERSKWAEGRYLAVELDAALERADTKAKGQPETIAALFSADTLVPGHLAGEPDGATSFFDEIDDKQNRHAVGVSKELREGMRQSVEILANEVIAQRLAKRLGVYGGTDKVDPTELTKQCLRYLYRLIVLLYAESAELGVLPTNDDAYIAGYSLDRLRELVLVELTDEHARTGTHLDESLKTLFALVNDGYHADVAEQMLVFDTAEPEATRSAEDYLQFPGLDATIFDPGSTPLLDSVSLRNEALQQVLALLMLNREGKKKTDQRGFISYAQLGINQLGAVYEGLMAYTGFFAQRDDDLYEVAKGGDPSDGTWMVPVSQADDYPEEVFVKVTDPISGRTERVRHPSGSFVYRLAGRDRQRSASYYTPEVLTSCVVRHALAELLGTDDHARVPGGSAGITEAKQILDLTICEPALGSGAFLNEAINQLSAEYLKRRQAELGETLDAERYQRELQKVKAHFALHQSYGVDLNATAVELAEVSLWLNCMYPGLKAPWFGLRLRRGNSLVGARRATWRAGQLKDKVWAKDTAANAIPPVHRPLSEPLDPEEIHHFLLPGHGWAAVASRPEARELAPEQAESLMLWRSSILTAPRVKDGERLTALSAGVERLWVEAADLLERLNLRMRRPLDLYGTEGGERAPADDRRTAEKILRSPDSALGRLRLVMDAWMGLWFWPLDGGVRPPSWVEWLTALERIIGPDPATPPGQLDLFADLAAIEAAEVRRANGREAVGGILQSLPWLDAAQELAQSEGAWHWDLEFSPALRAGGFNLQVGNPPWVQLTWNPIQIVGDIRPSAVLSGAKFKAENPDEIGLLVSEISRQSAVDFMGSPLNPQRAPNGGSNLYRAFLGVAWLDASRSGVTGFIYPGGMFSDKGSSLLRTAAYLRLRRLFEFSNQLKLFEEVGNTRPFVLAIFGSPSDKVDFVRSCYLLHPHTLDQSFSHSGAGELIGVKFPDGTWDLRPHSARLIPTDVDTLALIAGVLGESANPLRTRLLSFVVAPELEAMRTLKTCDHLSDGMFLLNEGLPEEICDENKVGRDLISGAQQVLQSPHISVANPVAQATRIPYKNHRSYVSVDLKDVSSFNRPTRFILNLNDEPQIAVEQLYIHLYKRWCDPAGERTLEGALVPPGTLHIGTSYGIRLETNRETAILSGLWSSIPIDYIVKSLAVDNIRGDVVRLLPWITGHQLNEAMLLRVARLNSLTSEYDELWRSLYLSIWARDTWTYSTGRCSELAEIGPVWTSTTPLRRDFERRLALVEIDALAALMLGLTSEQLSAMYRTQFPVLRKYEYSMAFDAEGRKICKYHQSAGYQQAQLQQEAKDKQRGQDWKSVWKMFEQWEEDPDSVDWEGQFTPPFTRVDREAEMTQAYVEFQRRLDAGEYG